MLKQNILQLQKISTNKFIFIIKITIINIQLIMSDNYPVSRAFPGPKYNYFHNFYIQTTCVEHHILHIIIIYYIEM